MKILFVFAALALACASAAPSSGDTRIVGGNVATAHQFVYQVYLEIHGAGPFMNVSYSFCGGSIINEFWVLTAGHCTIGCQEKGAPGYVEVFTGAMYSNQPEPDKYSYTASCGGDVLTHEDYNAQALRSDVGLIHIVNGMNLTMGIAWPIKLPPNMASDHNTSEGDIVTYSGWGKTSDAAGGVSDVLKFGVEPVISQELCRETYGILIGDSKFCTAVEVNLSGTCNGDSGGPVTWLLPGCPESERELRGVVSFVSSAGCASGGVDGQCRTKQNLEWIHRTSSIAESALPTDAACRA